MKLHRLFFVIALVALILSQVGAQEDDEQGEFSVNVSGSCSIYSPNFLPPGSDYFAYNNDTEVKVNAIAKNETSSFYYSLVNDGNRNTSITQEIDLRKVETLNSSWGSGDPRGLTGQNVSYEPETDNLTHFIPHGETTALNNTFLARFKQYTATHSAGNYMARLQANYSCSEGNGTVEDYVYFRIIDAPGAGGGVEQGDFPSDDPYPAQSNVTTNESSNYTSPDMGGNDTSDLERPRNANQTGNYTTNTTVPADANRTGETSNQTVPQDVNQTGEEGPPNPGDSDSPGQTPEPEPEPEPTPGDSPNPGQSDSPQLEIDIEPTNNTYPAYQGQYAPAELLVQNIGEAPVNDLELIPEIGEIRPDWEVRNATVSNLSAGENVTRDVFVRPPEDQPVGEYLVPVRAQNPDAQLDLDYFTVDVRRSEFESKVQIAEAPRTVSLGTGSSQELPILVENPGRRNITNVSARLQNAEDCGDVSASSEVSIIDVNETASLSIGIEAGENAESCEATLIVSSADGAYSFSDVTIETNPEEGLIPEEQRVPFIAIAWTFVLAAYAVLRKRYELNSSLVKLPFFMLLMGETVIILYMLVNYYGVMSVSFLPF